VPSRRAILRSVARNRRAGADRQIAGRREEKETGLSTSLISRRGVPPSRGVIKGGDGLFGVVAAHEVNVIAIGRKGQAAVARGGGRDDLGVASRGNMPEPEGLQAIFLQHVEQVFSIGGDSGEEDMTIIVEVFDRHAFDWQSFFVRQEE